MICPPALTTGCVEDMGIKRPFRENFLHYLWQLQAFERQQLLTTEGEPILILHPGVQQFDAGPDFHNARIRVGGMLWAGNVELHVFSSE